MSASTNTTTTTTTHSNTHTTTDTTTDPNKVKKINNHINNNNSNSNSNNNNGNNTNDDDASKKEKQKVEPVFSLLVTLHFTTHAVKAMFLKEFAPVAQYVRQHEPETLSYEVLQNDQDDLQVLIVERYVNKERSYLQIHKTSPAFLQLRPKLAAWHEQGLVTITGQSYRDAGIGFVERSSQVSPLWSSGTGDDDQPNSSSSNSNSNSITNKHAHAHAP